MGKTELCQSHLFSRIFCTIASCISIQLFSSQTLKSIFLPIFHFQVKLAGCLSELDLLHNTHLFNFRPAFYHHACFYKHCQNRCIKKEKCKHTDLNTVVIGGDRPYYGNVKHFICLGTEQNLLQSLFFSLCPCFFVSPFFFFPFTSLPVS